MIKRIMILVAATVLLVVVSCTVETDNKVEVKPIEIKPIHITIDVNIKVDRELDDFFGDLDKKADKLEKKKQ